MCQSQFVEQGVEIDAQFVVYEFRCIERDTNFKATITPEQLAELRQLIDHSIESWTSVLKNHQVEQTKLITEHESNMRKILRQNEGVWFSDFWMKVYVIFLFVYTIGLGLVVYCAT